MGDSIVYNGKSIRTIGSYQVAVVGGGFSGICAAIGAARAGARVVLVERNGNLGGQAAEVDTWGLDGFIDHYGKQIIKGIPWEILERAVEEGGSDTFWSRVDMGILEREGVQLALVKMGLKAYVPYIETGTFMNPFNDQYINPGAYRYVAQRMLDEAGVDVLIDMPVIDAIIEGNKVAGVVIQGEFEKFAVMGDATVDATQQAQVCALAGKRIAHRKVYMGTLPRVAGVDVHALIDYVRRTPDQWLLRPMLGKTADADEMLALADSGNPLAIHGFEHALAVAVKENAEYEPLIRKDGGQLMFFYEREGMGAYWTFGDDFNRVMADDPIAMSKAILAGRRQQWLMHKFFRKFVPGFSEAHLVDTYPHISKAYEQSWDPSGFTEYEITKREIEGGSSDRADVIARIMGHPRFGQNPRGWLLPYASLIPKDLDGVLVTGKAACRRIHYIATCAAVGQAAGVAAAIAVTTRKPLRRADAKAIAAELERQGAVTR
jgi:FAD dependent oxidoreductase.